MLYASAPHPFDKLTISQTRVRVQSFVGPFCQSRYFSRTKYSVLQCLQYELPDHFCRSLLAVSGENILITR